MINGIDISHYQTIESLKPAKAAGYQFVIIKATDGMRVDSKLEKHVNLALDAEMIPGFYHYMKANVPGHIEADHFLSTVYPYMQKFDNKVLYHHVDVEKYYVIVSKPEYSRELQVWLEYVDANSRLPGIYSSQWMWQLMTGNAPWGKPYFGWLAQHTGVPYSLIPVGWDPAKIKFHQWGIAGKHPWCPVSVPGVQGECDLNRFFGTMDELRMLANYDVTVPEPEPEPLPEPVVQFPPGFIKVNVLIPGDNQYYSYDGELTRKVF